MPISTETFNGLSDEEKELLVAGAQKWLGDIPDTTLDSSNADLPDDTSTERSEQPADY